MQKILIFLILIGMGLAVSGFYLGSEGFRLRDMEIKTMRGEIIPFETDLQKVFVIYLGSNTITLPTSELNEGFNLRRIIDFGYDYPVQMSFTDNKLLVSVEIKNADGDIVAKIVDNHWVVNTNPIIARDRNYNAYAFEVIDSDLVPVLQVVLRDRSSIYVGGLFNFETVRVLVTPKGLVWNPSDDTISEYTERIFRYPSDEHLGEMIMMERQERLIDIIFGIRKSYWYIFGGSIAFGLGVISDAVFGYYLYKLSKEEKRIEKKQKEKKPKAKRTRKKRRGKKKGSRSTKKKTRKKRD